MIEKQLATLANFNCTFKVNDKTFGMLHFFKDIIWPALNDKSLIRVTRKDKLIHTKYHISDLKIVEVADGSLALVGKHIKRTLLEISPDYTTDKGFFGKDDIKPSAPYSTFIILLNNHRVIYYPNKTGAPDIRSFASTIDKIITLYIKNNRTKLKKELIANNYIFKGIKYKNMKEFVNNYLDIILPLPELNVIAIEYPKLVKCAFDNIKTIRKVTFKFYKPNNEPLDFNNFFARSFDILDATGSSSMNQTLNSPTKNDIIQDAVTSSEGKTDYIIHAVNNNSEDVKLTPSEITQRLPIEVDNLSSIEDNAKKVYNQVKEKEILTKVSADNEKSYKKIFSYLKSLI